MLPPFRYFFLEEDGRSLFKSNGVVASTGIQTPLVDAPEGTEDIHIAWERIMKYFGLNRNFSPPNGFYKDAAFILRSEFYNKNIERKIYFLIQQLQLVYGPTDYKFLYTYLYKGELDFSTFNSDNDRASISINEGGLMKQFKANENTVYAFPFDSDAKDLVMDGILLDGLYNWLVAENVSLSDCYPGLYMLPGDGTAPGLAIFTVQQNNISGDPDINTIEFFGEASQDISDVHITGTIKNLNNLGAPGPLSVRIIIFNTISNTVRLTIDLAPDDPYPENYNLPVDQTIDLLEGDRLFFKSASHFSESSLSLTAKSKHPRSITKFYKPFDAYKRLVEKVSGSQANAESALLEANSNIALTCGDAIRGIADAKIRTSLSAFFDDYNVTCFAGLSIDNGKIKMEDRATFFDPSDPIDLGEVKNHKHSYAADMVGNVLKVGNTKPDINDLNGKFDPNGSSIYTLPITRVTKPVDLVGPYKKGPYEIEITRINMDGKTTTDNDNDNDCFVIHVKENPETFENVAGSTDGENLITLTGMAGDIAIFQSVMAFYITGLGITVMHIIESVAVNGADLDIVTVEDITGAGAFTGYSIAFPYTLDRTAVVDPAAEVCPSPETIFNVIFTPKNILNKHSRWLRSILWGFDADKIKFESGDKNTNFKATVNGVVVDEDKNVNINTLGERMFYPVYHDIETLVPIAIVDLLEENPNRCFKFKDVDLDQEFTGFNIKSALATNSLQPQAFKLLSSPLNDLTKLIY